MRRVLIVAVIVVAVLGASPNALAKSYSLPSADVEVRIQPDGTVEVTEHLTYSFSGFFSGGYRDIPLRRGEFISDITVREGPITYSPGAATELGSEGAAHTFGWTFIPEGVRIVWHYAALDTSRTFTISYKLRRFVAVYNDVADFNMKVWGDEWTVPVDRLTAEVELPGAAGRQVRVWGHVKVPPLEGAVAPHPAGAGASLSASDVAPGNWVEVRVVFPRRLLFEATSVRTINRDGLKDILVEERAFSEQYNDQLALQRRDRRRLDWVRGHAIPLSFSFVAPLVLPGGLVARLIWSRYGREPDVASAGRYVMEPPGSDPPALVAALLKLSGSRVTGDAYASTLFDLIRRGYIDAIPTVTQRKT
jgi:uncharacterized membrane protein